ncbi:MAG TPA: PQQ-binding-like beta-propeller repeat protein, partial [Casimicrobiaceae bacterium]|nr:PQQ-binding-like beta-propeller repeat protein [Casimicrobiaceae bacterium]
MHRGTLQAGIARLVVTVVRQIAPAALAATFVIPAAAQDAAQWPLAGKDYANTRYSELAEINTTNVKNLKLAFTFSTGVLRGHEAAPVVVGSTMYIVTPYPNHVYALDLAQPGAPVKWQFSPKPLAASQGIACCDTVNRGLAYADGRIFMNTLDGQTIALDANTGKEIWRTQLGDIRKGETVTMAPLVAKGKVFVGNSGGEYGVRGRLTALDARSGKEVWRAYNTGPDKDVLIGANFKPFYSQDQGKDLGVSSWPPEAWKIGGGTVWGFLSYDPDLDLIYYGTANPGPWNPDQRPGDNKWTSGIFARSPDTGEARWFYQMSPHDMHDYDGVNENILVDMSVNGQNRKVLLHPDRNGYVYMMDRASGEVLAANPFVYVNTSSGVDLRTGKLNYNPEKAPTPGRVTPDACPASPGGKDWQP